ncbi:MAG: hypothetical protein RSD78_09340 [Oscillospiraceae bacterium]
MKEKHNKTQQLLEDACHEAVAVLTQVLMDSSLPNALRVDVAKDVLNRAYGKTVAVQKKQDDTVQTIALVKSTEELSK